MGVLPVGGLQDRDGDRRQVQAVPEVRPTGGDVRPTHLESQICVRCGGTGTNRGRTCGRCGGDGLEFDLRESWQIDRMETLRFERYQWLLNGEVVGLVLGAGIGLACAGHVVGVVFAMVWLGLHLYGRRRTRG